MNRILLFCALGALLGCKPTAEPSGEVITLSYATSSESKTDALTAGDEVAVFARISGTEQFFLDGEKFVTGSDGRTLSTSPTVYYPEAKQAVHFYAYVPSHTGVFSVPTDQSTPAALKQADLCWAQASSTPVSMVPLSFEHQLARLVITTNEPTAKIACSVVSSGSLNPVTAEFTLGSSKSEVFTTGNELILPAQPLNRLVLTVSGVDYLFDTPITLEAGKTTSLHLTLNTSTHTVSLANHSITAWQTTLQSGGAKKPTNNVMTFHWLPLHSRASEVNRIALYVRDESSGIISEKIMPATHTGSGVFTAQLTDKTLNYPFTVLNVRYCKGAELIGASPVSSGALCYKSGALTIGCVRSITPPTPARYIYDAATKLYWADGPLGTNGQGGCTILGGFGTMGIFFRVGSLIGWSGGTNGDGNGVAFPAKREVVVRPKGCQYTATTWETNYYKDNDHGYLGAIEPSLAYGANFKDNLEFARGAYWYKGVGDPCTYYLGEKWRVPTGYEVASLMYVGWGVFSGVSLEMIPYNGWYPAPNPTYGDCVYKDFPSGPRQHIQGQWIINGTTGAYAHEYYNGREVNHFIGYTGGGDYVVAPSDFMVQGGSWASGGSGYGFQSARSATSYTNNGLSIRCVAQSL